MRKILLIFPAVFILASCNVKESENETITILTSTSFVTETVEKVAGDRLEVQGLIDFGIDPHSYEPTPRQIAMVEEASMIFVNGFGLEEGLLDLLEKNSRATIVELSTLVDPIGGDSHDEHEEDADHDEDGHDDENEEREAHDDDDHDEHSDDEHQHHGHDPHTWMSPLNMMLWVDRAVAALSELVPGEKEYLLKQGEAYKKELLELHEYMEDQFSAIEPSKRTLITDHDALSYLARDYDFEVAGTIIPGTSTNSDTSAIALIQLIMLMNSKGVSTLYVGETSGDNMVKMAENLKSELDRPVQILFLKTGSLDKKGMEADNYIDYMKFNTDQIVKGLKEN